MTAFPSWFERHHGPKLLVAAAIYASWLLPLASHESVPWWIKAPLAGFVVQEHSSLQHEAIHSMRGLPSGARSSGGRSASVFLLNSIAGPHMNSHQRQQMIMDTL
jgi:hypothetical protein